MFLTPDQLLAHLIGDYIVQSDWMATDKLKKATAALVHATSYSLPFLLMSPSWKAWAFIVGTHFLIDRYRLAKYLCYAKNFLAPKWIQPPMPPKTCCKDESKEVCAKCANRTLPPMIRNHPWKDCQATGYGPDKPIWMSVWLLIITDNICHLICNALAFKYL